jgi:glucuronoarabinoxylan endo-1,4-beta-xylanase
MKLSTTFFAGFLLLSFFVPHSQGQTATIYWDNVDQVIDGFGASCAGENITAKQAAFFFSTGPDGIGLSLLRSAVPDDGSCVTVNAQCAGQVTAMQLAIANGARVWSSPWSPPGSMKSNGSVDDGGTLLPGSYGPYASYLANYVKSLRTLYGINLVALSVQNEPEAYVAKDSAIWTAANFDTFIKNNLGPTFAAEGLTDTLIMSPETGQWKYIPLIASTTMADPDAAKYVGIVSWHDYVAPPSALNPYASMGKKYWETEAGAMVGWGTSTCGGCFDPSMTDALMWAQTVDNRLAVANANAWHYWILINYTNDNGGLTGGDTVTIPKRAYMLGNYSKFVRPGFYRIDATHTPQSGVLVSAYKNPSTEALAIVVINQNSSSVSQTFTLNGTRAATVTPWITSASLNLVQQLPIAVIGGSFTYNLPAASVITFVGNAAGQPPTGLKAAIR